jgi:ferrochelatase
MYKSLFSALQLLNELFTKDPQTWSQERVPHTVVPAWYQRPGYIRVVARLVLEQLADYSEEEMRDGVHVLFSAHGVPVSYIESESYCLLVRTMGAVAVVFGTCAQP